MTFEELKAKVDAYIGIVSEVVHYRSTYKALIFKSPTGVVLFTMGLLFFDGSWRCDGQTGALPESWDVLHALHDNN